MSSLLSSKISKYLLNIGTLSILSIPTYITYNKIYADSNKGENSEKDTSSRNYNNNNIVLPIIKKKEAKNKQSQEEEDCATCDETPFVVTSMFTRANKSSKSLNNENENEKNSNLTIFNSENDSLNGSDIQQFSLKDTAPSDSWENEDLKCPMNRRTLGRSTWDFLHTMAVNYPIQPTLKQQADMKQFIYLLSEFYPCGYCADKMKEELVRHPPKVSNRYELEQYMCELHNEVNDRMGKQIFDCSKYEARWKNGLPGCKKVKSI